MLPSLSRRSKFTTYLVVTSRTWSHPLSWENLDHLLLLARKLLSRYHDRHHTPDLGLGDLNLKGLTAVNWKHTYYNEEHNPRCTILERSIRLQTQGECVA